MGRRRARRRWILPVAVSLMAAAALVSVVGLCMPWVVLDAGLLTTLGLVDPDPVVGFRIPLLVADVGDDPLLQGGLALDELFSGRLDRAAARVLFGERFEEEWAPVVFLPAAWCLLVLALARFRGLRLLAPFAAVISIVLCLGAAWSVAGLTQPLENDPAVRVMAGLWVTVASVGACSLGLVLLTFAPGRRRRRRRRKPRLKRERSANR